MMLARAAERVLLISMPFGALERPALSLGLLKAHCSKLAIACDIRYFGFDFARRIGLGDYIWLCSDDVPYTAFAGEWVFAEALYGIRPQADAEYIAEVLVETWKLSDAQRARLTRIRTHVEPFLDACIEEIARANYTFVGFTSVFQQNLASLALAGRLKRERPEVTTAFGGANWEGPMGIALQEQFPFVDLVFSGEADESFPEVLRARAAQRPLSGVAGLTVQGEEPGQAVGRIGRMDDVPVPDFDDFFHQFFKSVAGHAVTPILLIETARGCWWGERSHCTFCGLNGATMAFRAKSADRVLQEIVYLRVRHGVRTFNVVDNILDMSYFRNVLPEITKARLEIDFFWEIKSNMSRAQVRQLRDAGVLSVQPGIESLSDNVLRLMRKGVTAFRNIELLKWCREFGVKPYWNLLYGFPGETAEDYLETKKLIYAIWHLEPPTGCGPIRIDRFSPYHCNASSFGLVNLRPMRPFAFLYPFAPEALERISYYFDFDYADDRQATDFATPAIEAVQEWIATSDRGMLELHEDGKGGLVLMDTRFARDNGAKRASLTGWKAAVFLACDRAQTLSALLPFVAAEPDAELALARFLARCVEHRFMVTNGKAWLSVAVQSSEAAADAIAGSLQCTG